MRGESARDASDDDGQAFGVYGHRCRLAGIWLRPSGLSQARLALNAAPVMRRPTQMISSTLSEHDIGEAFIDNPAGAFEAC